MAGADEPAGRRAALSRLAAVAATTGVAGGGLAAAATTVPATPMMTRPIPSTGEALPVIGCGTWRGFDHPLDSAEGRELRAVVAALFAAGGSVIDSSPMYGRAEAAVGRILEEAGERDRAFVATKVWTRGRAAGIKQMETSMQLLRTPHIDLMQVHNLVDVDVQLATLADWKRAGRVRHVGVTHYHAGAYDALETVLRSRSAARPIDTVQLNYAVDDREAERRLLPLAQEQGIAVIVNRPFGGGGLLGRLRDRPLPGWAAGIDCTSWAQVLLKFALAHPAVTCVIPGTGRAAHMRDNAKAGSGPLPDAALRRTIIEAIGAG